VVFALAAALLIRPDARDLLLLSLVTVGYVLYRQHRRVAASPLRRAPVRGLASRSDPGPARLNRRYRIE
jgi:hypothetical protein